MYKHIGLVLLLKTHAGAEDKPTRFTSDAHLHLLRVTQVPTGAQTADILNVLKPITNTLKH